MVYSSTLTANLNKFSELSPRERRRLLQALLLLPVIHLGLRLLGYARLHRVMERLAVLKPQRRTISEIEVLPHARTLTRLVCIAAGHGVYRATCLRKSLLTWWFLRRDGIRSQICFGVRTLDRRLEAHAWVEWDGIVLNDSITVHQQYRALQDGLPVTTLGL